jgi:RNA polymerase sigma-70 factor (ECF subfamily)
MEYLVRRHQLRALRLAYQITRNRQTAEDVVADSYVVVYRSIKSGRYKDAAFEPWFLRVVANRAISETRRATALGTILRRLHVGSPPGPDPENEVERNAQSDLVHRALASVRPEERAALSLRYLLDLDDRAVAEILNCPIGTVKTRLRRGRARMRAALTDMDPETWPVQAVGGLE